MKESPTILQMEAAECGAAALGMIFAHHRLFLPLERLREECGVSRDGTHAAALIEVARRHGFSATGFRTEARELARHPMPAIVHWNHDHFVVLERLERRRARIIDPAQGRRALTRAEFERSFTGTALVFVPGPDFRPGGSPARVLPALFEWLADSRSLAIGVALLGFLLVLPGIAIPAASRIFVDQVLARNREDILGPLLLGMALTAGIRGALTWLQKDALIRLSTRLCSRLSSEYLKKALRLPLSFHLARHPGELASRVELSDRLSWLLSGDVPTVALASLMAVIYGACMFWIEPGLAAIALSFAAAGFLVDRAGAASRADRAGIALHERSLWAGVTATALQGIETLKANGIESAFLEKWSSQLARAARSQASVAFAAECHSALTRFLHAAGTLVVLGEGAARVIRGELTIGTLVAFQSLMSGFLGPLAEIAGFAAQLDLIRAQLARFRDVLGHPDGAAAAPGRTAPRFPAPCAGRLEFEDVAFGYNPFRPPLVAGLRFEISPGSRVAIVGESGSGKSTIARLAAGLVVPWTGEVRIEGSAAFVEQEIQLFEGTIEENLTLWDRSVPREALTRAIRDACLEDLVARLPEGLATRLTEGGRNLSGGERQRLEIARALARDPSILILDEATSALDPETEGALHENLRRRGCACVHITHRLSAVRGCDEILVLESGRLVERGNHDRLVRARSAYRRLVLSEAP